MVETEWSRRTLILVGHGSESQPESARSVETLAGALRGRGIFAEVRTAFLKARPFLADVLDGLNGRTAYVVPHLAAEGVVGTEAMAPALAGRARVIVCRATGTHPDIAMIAAARLAELRAAFALDPARLGVVVAGHGTAQNPDSAARGRALAEALLARRAAGEAEAAFIEEPPLLSDWDRLVAAAEIAVVPLLMAEGRHGGEDVARMIGVEPTKTSEPFAGPFALRGRRLWLLRPLGADPAFAEIVLARVAEAGGVG